MGSLARMVTTGKEAKVVKVVKVVKVARLSHVEINL